MSRRFRAGRVCACRLCGRPAYTYVLVRLAHQSSNLRLEYNPSTGKEYLQTVMLRFAGPGVQEDTPLEHYFRSFSLTSSPLYIAPSQTYHGLVWGASLTYALTGICLQSFAFAAF